MDVEIFTTNDGSLLTRCHPPQAVLRLVSETLVAHTISSCLSSVFRKPLFLVTVYPTGGQPFQTHFPPDQLVAASQIPFKPQLHPLSLSQKIQVQNKSLRGQQGLWVQHYATSVSVFLSFPRTNCTSLKNQDAFPVITICHWHLCRKTFF